MTADREAAFVATLVEGTILRIDADGAVRELAREQAHASDLTLRPSRLY